MCVSFGGFSFIFVYKLKLSGIFELETSGVKWTFIYDVFQHSLAPLRNTVYISWYRLCIVRQFFTIVKMTLLIIMSGSISLFFPSSPIKVE